MFTKLATKVELQELWLSVMLFLWWKSERSVRQTGSETNRHRCFCGRICLMSYIWKMMNDKYNGGGKPPTGFRLAL